jgi:hypothetical protein
MGGGLIMAAPRVSLGLICLAVLAQCPLLTAAEDARARSCWETGQAALRNGETDRAIDCFQQCLRLDPHYDRPHLSLAAAYMEKGDEKSALPHLATYVQTNPDHVVIRAHYADLLLRMRFVHDARAQFEKCIALAQDQPKTELSFLLRSHSKLMEIAQTADDEYAERLHRGIGLYLLACARSEASDLVGDVSSEGLWCRAVEELKQAAALRSEEAQPHWYLYLTWLRLAQRAQAVRALKKADRAAAFSYLTPAEEQELQLASRKLDEQETPGRLAPR